MKRPVLAILASGAIGFAFGALAVASTGAVQDPAEDAVCPVTGAAGTSSVPVPPGFDPGRGGECPYVDGEGRGSTSRPPERCPAEAGAPGGRLLRV